MTPRGRAGQPGDVDLVTAAQGGDRAAMEALLDRHYESPVGFDEPGFGAYAGIRVTSR